MRRSTEFSSIVGTGMRARRGAVVVHQLVRGDAGPPRVGLIVGRVVGNSVQRHRVSRRLRAQLATRLDRLPAGSGTVVRALPSAAGCSSVRLGDDLDGALARLTSRS